MKTKILLTAVILGALLPYSISGQHTHGTRKDEPRPLLIVNIVVGGMKYGQTELYRQNLTDRGFLAFADKGFVFTESRYDFMQTNAAATLATLTTGCNPSVHGVIGEQWQDYITGERVRLIDDPATQGLGHQAERNRYSPVNLTAPTLADELRKSNPRSKAVTIAASPLSAIAMGGTSSDTFWFDASTGAWTSSSKYMLYLPGWVVSHNEQNYGRKESLRNYKWTLSKSEISYVNSRFCIFDIAESVRFRRMPSPADSGRSRERYDDVLDTPMANDLVADFARQALIYEDLGRDGHTDILNICFDAPRNAVRLYGPESMEAEDMLYRLDKTIASLLDFIKIQVGEERVLFVLTADHGTSDSYDLTAPPRERFNGDQFRVIINSFLGAQYGSNDWVKAYYDRRLYLNRTAVYNAGLSLEEVQTRAAGFALQFRGISNVLTGTALQASTFSDNYLRKVQNGYYPRRSGDLALNLIAGWIEMAEGVRSSSGSLYDYDTHVPLMVMGCGIKHGSTDTPVDISSVAPTLAYIMQINRPAASTAPVIGELKELFR